MRQTREFGVRSIDRMAPVKEKGRKNVYDDIYQMVSEGVIAAKIPIHCKGES